MTDANTWWDEAYAAADDPAWDLGRPQSAIERLAERGRFEGRVLDVGCGTGTHVRFLAERGHRAVGIDCSAVAIERARAQTDETLPAAFRVRDVLGDEGDASLGAFDTLLDSGTFHVFDAADRSRYADRLKRYLKPGGWAFVLAFGENAPPELPPNRIGRDELAAAFDDGWRIRERCDDPFETRNGSIPGVLATIERVGDDEGDQIPSASTRSMPTSK